MRQYRQPGAWLGWWMGERGEEYGDGKHVDGETMAQNRGKTC